MKVNIPNSEYSLEVLDVRCPNHVMILKLRIRNVDDKPNVHKYGYSLEGLEIKRPPPFTSPLRTYLAQYLIQFILAH